MRTMTIQLSDETALRLNEFQRTYGKSLDAIIEEAIQRNLEEVFPLQEQVVIGQAKIRQRARRLGVSLSAEAVSREAIYD